MRQKIGQFSLGSVAVMGSLFAAHHLGNSPAKAETFDTRFAAVESVKKGDRLGAVATVNEGSVVIYSDHGAGLTVATKISGPKPESSGATPVPNPRKKMLVGCEPSFSPVTTPSMANVTGRCIAARDVAIKFAGLAQ